MNTINKEQAMTTTKTIRCGNCKGTHGHSSEVRACYTNAPATSTAPTPLASVGTLFSSAGNVQASSGAIQVPATERQVAFIKSLLADRDHGWAEAGHEHIIIGASTSKGAASALIEALLGMPKVKVPMPQVSPQAGYPQVPEGYYAIESATGNNDLDFFVVQHGKVGGKWEGRSFVKRVIGGHPEFSVQGVHARIVLERIQDAGVEAAAAKYGQEIGRCGRCNRTLTDEVSRAEGIGPVCRNLGW